MWEVLRGALGGVFCELRGDFTENLERVFRGELSKILGGALGRNLKERGEFLAVFGGQLMESL